MKHVDQLIEIVRQDPILWSALKTARDLDLPDWWIVSGAIYNTVWNTQTGRPPGHGIKDMDLFYFDQDTSWAAEDQIIQRALPRFADNPPIEIRNQARVHLWYSDHFGHSIPPLTDCRDSIMGFAARTHAVGVKLIGSGEIEVSAPFGLEDIFEQRLVPNPRHHNRKTYEEKSNRIRAFWPEVDVVEWPNFDRLGRSEEEDWPELLSLIQRAFAFMDGRIDPPSSLQKLDAAGLERKAREEICLIARSSSTPVGCIFCAPQDDHLYVGKMAVDPARQGQGIGKWLMQSAEDQARWLGLSALVLQTRIELVENHAAFARMGFVRIGETSHPGYAEPTSFTMRKSL